MDVIKGKIVNTADGSGLIKPVMPTPPNRTELDALKISEASNTAMYQRWYTEYNAALANKNYTESGRLDKELKILSATIDQQRSRIATLQSIYDSEYRVYQDRISQYNKDFSVWAEATAKLNNTDPIVLKAQIDAEVSKTDNALKIAAASSSSSNKKWIIIGVIVIVIIVAGATAWYFIKKRKG